MDPDLVYLNSAALGVPPDPVIAAVHEGYLRLSQDPDAGKIDYRRYNDEVAIPELAALMGARPEELAINRNASVGLELVADGVNWPARRGRDPYHQPRAPGRCEALARQSCP